MRIAHVAPVATTIPPPKSGSVETMASLLTEGLVARGHDVTLFATADSKTKARLAAIYPHGYWHDENMWPWELYEMLNLAAAVERAREFDIIHYEAAYYPMSLAFTRLLSGMLYGVSPTDPATLAAVVLGVLGVSAVAALVPAVRAARLEPIEVLRDE